MASIVLPIDDSDILAALSRIEALLQVLITMVGAEASTLANEPTILRSIMADALDPIRTGVADLEGVIPSLEQLLQNLATELAAQANNPAAIQAIADQLESDKGTLVGLVTQFTPPAPTPAP